MCGSRPGRHAKKDKGRGESRSPGLHAAGREACTFSNGAMVKTPWRGGGGGHQEPIAQAQDSHTWPQAPLLQLMRPQTCLPCIHPPASTPCSHRLLPTPASTSCIQPPNPLSAPISCSHHLHPPPASCVSSSTWPGVRAVRSQTCFGADQAQFCSSGAQLLGPRSRAQGLIPYCHHERRRALGAQARGGPGARKRRPSRREPREGAVAPVQPWMPFPRNG